MDEDELYGEIKPKSGCENRCVDFIEKKKLAKASLMQNEIVNKMISEINIPMNQILSLIQKFLESIGFNDISAALASRSGLSAEPERMLHLIEMTNQGRFYDAINSVPSLLPQENDETHHKIRVALIQYYFKDIVASGNQIEALKFLRETSQFSLFSKDDAFMLTLPLMFPQSTYIHQSFGLIGPKNDPTNSLIELINSLAPNTCCTDPNRLETLLKYSIMFQYEKCQLHSHVDVDYTNCSLYKDHVCDWKALPNIVFQHIELNKNAIWGIEYSHNGTFFAVCTRDKYLIVFSRSEHAKTYVQHKSFEFDSIPSHLKWSPDDSMILVVTTCGRYIVFVCRLSTIPPHDTTIHTSVINEMITCSDWFPDSKRYAVGTVDGNLYVANVEGQLLQILHGFRTSAILVVSLGDCIIVADHLKRLILWNLRNSETQCIWQDEEIINGLTLCPDKQHILFSVKGRGLYLFSLRYSSVIRSYSGIKQHLSYVKCSFMPENNSKIFCTGCESGHLLYWHLYKGEPVKVIKGCTNVGINSVSWSPIDQHTLISASEDSTVTIWISDSSSQH